MKSRSSNLGCFAHILLAIGLTCASLWFARIEECPAQSSYDCRPQAGFPLPIIRDQTGSSPTGGWGRLDPSDWPDPFGIVLDVLFYGALIQLVWTTVQVARRMEKTWALLPTVPLLLWVLLLLLGPPYVEAAERREWQYRASVAGDWNGTDQSTGAEFTLRFQEPGTVLIVHPQFPYGNMGNYYWDGTAAIHLSFRWASPFPEDGAGPCTYVPSFLKRDCHDTVTEPPSNSAEPGMSYPVSPNTANSAPPPEGYPALESGPYPAPPEPSSYVRGLRSELSADFEIKIEGDTMTLTHESGAVQTLHR